METKELKIQIPEGYEIDKENSTFEKIVFKEIDTKPKSWGEYCKQQEANGETGYYFDTDCSINEASWVGCATFNNWRNVLPSKELAEAFLAMMQLMSLRQAWIGDWKLDWKEKHFNKWCIVKSMDKFCVDVYSCLSRPLSFPTMEMAEEFSVRFKGLLEIAKPLL